MPKILSPGQVAQYRRDGFAFPVPVLDAGEVRELRADLEYWEKQQGHPLDYPEKSKSYLLWIKEVHTPAYVRWHQDGAYFFLEAAE